MKQPSVERRNGGKGQCSSSLDNRPGSPAEKKQEMTDEGQTCRSSMKPVAECKRIADYIQLYSAKKNVCSNFHCAQVVPPISKAFST